MSTTEMRKEAREALKGNWGKAVCIVLAYIAISFVVGFVQGLFGEGSLVYDIIDIAYSIISVPISFGLTISFIRLKRGEEVKAFDFLEDGFSRFKKSWGISLQTLVKMFVPILCFIVLTVLIVAMNIYTTNATLIGNLMTSTPNMVLSLIFTVLEIACIIYIVSRGLLYALAYFIGYDNPELSSKDCVIRSEELMKGNRGTFFLLQLSFIGWAILSVLTIGIGLLWLAPYIAVAEVCFYEKVAKVSTAKVEEVEAIEE